MNAPRELVVVANTRIPSERAQALQVIQTAAAFARQGLPTRVLHARRQRELALPEGSDVFGHYGVPVGARPKLVPIPCLDWIERVPARFQFWPARLQELSFSRNAAKAVLEQHGDALVLSRELECAQELARRRFPRLFLEVHRVPAGATRQRWLRAAARGCRGVVAISGGVRDDLLALGLAPESLTVEHDGYEPARFAHAPSRAEARRRLRIPASARVVAYTGGLLDWKGVDVLVDAARALPEVQFLIAGGMEQDVARLRARAVGSSNVRIDGFQPPARVVEYLAAADVGVAPNRSSPEISSRYTSPLKVFEAMALGLPLVASDLPALRELLTHGVDAWLVPPDDPQALAEGLKKVLGDGALRSRLGSAFGARAVAHTWDARARRLAAWMVQRAP